MIGAIISRWYNNRMCSISLCTKRLCCLYGVSSIISIYIYICNNLLHLCIIMAKLVIWCFRIYNARIPTNDYVWLLFDYFDIWRRSDRAFGWKHLENTLLSDFTLVEYQFWIQILNCKNNAWISSIHFLIHWLTMHGLNSLLLSEVELEREVAHFSPFLSHRVVLCHYPRARGFISRFQSASLSWLTVSRVLNTNRDPLSRALPYGLSELRDHYH